MQAQGIKGTSYITADWMNTAGFMTTAQIQGLVSAGWSVANHSKTHPEFNTLNEAQTLAELQASITALQALGANAPLHIAYPSGQVANANAMTTAGMLTGRGISEMMFTVPTMVKYQIKSYVIENTDTLATVQGLVDTAIANGQILCLCFHQIATPANNTYKWSIEDFTALIAYIKNSGVAVKTIEDLYAIYDRWL